MASDRGRLKPAVRIVFAPIAFRDRHEKALLYGEADKNKRTIYIDPRLPEIGPTLLHELTHIKHPDWSEAKVSAYEKHKWGRMTWKEKARLFQLFGSAILKGEEDDD